MTPEQAKNLSSLCQVELEFFDTLPKDIRDLIRDHPYGTRSKDILIALQRGVSWDSIRATLHRYAEEARLNNLYPERRLVDEIDTVWRKPARNVATGSHGDRTHTVRKR